MHWRGGEYGLNAKYLNQLLIAKFPNLQKKYHDEISWQDGESTGSHIIYGDVLTPYLIERIERDDLEEIKEIFGFLEDVLLLGDKYSDEVIAFSVVESVFHLLSKNSHLQILLGSNTRVILEELEKNFNLTN